MPFTGRYRPFDISFAYDDRSGYRAEVLRSPVGQAEDAFALPLTQADIDNWQSGHPDAEQVRWLGAALFDALFSGPVGTALHSSLARMDDGDGLRLNLRLNRTPELAALPWELLYDAGSRRFLALDERTQIVRYLALNLPEPEALHVQPPLRMLAVLVSPADMDGLDVEREWAGLSQSLAPLQASGGLVLERLASSTLDGLRRRLLREPVHILHFVGHGLYDGPSDTGGLVFADNDGNAALAAASDVATLLRNHRFLRLLFLNACQGAIGSQADVFSGVAQTLVQQGIPAAIAMQREISDGAASVLAGAFYEAVAADYPVEAALAQARIALSTAGNLEWATPALFIRCEEGRLFTLNSEKENQSVAEKTQDQKTQEPWWNKVGNQSASVGGIDVSDFGGGDFIIANVGAGSKNVAVGKNITQTVYEMLGEPTPDDKEIIGQQLAGVEAALAAKQGQIDGMKAQMAQFQLQLLRGELSKVDESETPSASTITQIGDWLLDNLPELAGALTGLFATPAVGRVVGRAGESAVAWLRKRFGG